MRLAPRAERDLEDIEKYVAREAGGATAAGVVDDTLERLGRLDGMAAGAGTPRTELGDGVRSWPVGGYVAYYREKKGEIEVARIRHGARDPDSLALT